MAATAGVVAGAVGAAPAHAAVLGSVSTTSAISRTGGISQIGGVSSTRVPGQVLAGPVLTGRVLAGQQSSPLSQAGTTTGSPLASASVVSTTRQTPLAPSSTAASKPAAASAPTTSSAQHSSPAPTTSSAPASSQPAPHQASSAPQQPYLFYDSVTPNQIPSGNIVATYADGPFAVSQSQVSGAKWVLWIDVNGSDPNAEVLDVEPGDATPSTAASWAQARLTLHPNGYAVVYTMLSEWPAVQQAIGTLPQSMQSHVRYWIADPTGVPHVVAGASATQWDWGQNYDISTALPNF